MSTGCIERPAIVGIGVGLWALAVGNATPQRRQQGAEPVLEDGVVVVLRLLRLDQRPVRPVIGPQRWILFVVLGAANGRELHDG